MHMKMHASLRAVKRCTKQALVAWRQQATMHIRYLSKPMHEPWDVASMFD